MVAVLPGLVGALPADGLPGWARWQDLSWTGAGMRAVVPLYDAGGVLRSVRARSVGARADGCPKALPPRGYSTSGLVMANGAGKAWLRGGTSDAAIIVEGEPAWVLWCHAAPSVPVFGIISGSWAPALAGVVRSASSVLVVTDHDRAGDGYWTKIAYDVPHAVRWSHEKDDVSRYVAGGGAHPSS